MAISITIDIKVNSQSIANNTSNVTVNVNAKYSGGSYNQYLKPGWLTIDGTKYTFTAPFNDDKKSSGVETLFSKTVNVAHDSDGTKVLACKASYTSGVSSGTVGASVPDYELPTIPLKSTLAASNGTLGTKQTLTVTRKATSFTQTICTKSTDTSPDWIPPLSLANQNTTGTSVSVTFTITTYSGSTNVGSNTKTISCAIPASVKPTCTVAISDPTGYSSKYGAYVKGYSKFKVTVTPTLAYNSAIASYKTTANGSTYTSASFTTGVLKSSGTLTVSATVTDKRGRASAASKVTANVLNYTPPVISKLTVGRCEADGTANDQGANIIVSYGYSISSLNDKNVASATLKYKKSSDADYTTPEDFVATTDGSYIFAADTGSSYDILFTVTDDLETATKTTSASTAFTIMHWNASGYGMAIGKISELDGVFDVGMQTRLLGGILHPVLEPDTDLNDVRTPNTYIGANVSNYNYLNCPLTTGTFTLEVVGMGEAGQVKQRLTYCHKTASRVWERIYYTSAWGEWICVSDFDGQLLWEGGFFMHDTQEINLAEPVSKQRTGIVLVFSRYSSGTVQNYHFTYHFVPKMAIAMHAGYGSVFHMGAVEGDYFAAKYLYISDQTIKGNSYNDDVVTDANSGITYTNNATVLRYVIGV